MCVDVRAYFERQKEQLGQESRLVKDFSVFDFNYVPEEPLIREECKMLIDEMIRFDLSGVANHQAIIGSRGSGKTLMLKYLQRITPEHSNLDFVYANCRQHNSSFKVLAHLTGMPPRGASLPEVFERFCRIHSRKTVVVLDEIDLLSPKDQRREILYLLSRSEQPFMVILLSNSPQVLKEMDPATRSSLQPMPVHFRNYDAQQIHEILRDRAGRGLKSWDDGQLSEIAALTTRLTNADARVAIKTLQYAVTRTGQDLQKCFEQARRDLVIDLINDLSDGTLMILWAVATATADLAKPIYERFCRYCQSKGEKPFSYMYFYSNLSYLQSVGLVVLISTKIGRSYTNRVMPTFDKAVVEQICKLRFDR
jgi:Cdc6-like AAA superfamily ATPase